MLPELNAEDWLEDWIEENLMTPQHNEDKIEMGREAAACRKAAGAAGISDEAVNNVAGGDLEAYLLRAQNSFTEAEIERKADSDKY